MKGVFRYLEHFTGHYVAFHLLSTLRNRLYDALEPLAPAGLASHHSGDIISRAVGDVDRIEVFYAHTIAPVVTAILVPGGTLVVLAHYDPRLALTLLPFLLIAGVAAPWLSDRLAKRYRSQTREAVGEVSAHLTDSIQGLREIAAFGAEDRRRADIRRGGEKLTKIQQVTRSAAGLQEALSDLAIAAGILSMLALSVRLIGLENLQTADLPAILALSTMIFGPVMAASNVLHDFNQAMAAADRLFTLIDQQPIVADTATALPVGPIEPSINFRHVTFRYPGQRSGDNGSKAAPPPTLADLDFTIPAGSTVALVGASGAGKSTVVNLLLRFWDPDQGQVCIGDRDARRFPLVDLRQRIAVVSQQAHIFNTTIRENLLLGNPVASQTEVERAAAAASIHDFILSLPEGYATKVGEMGSKLSGGQRQRIALARAFLKGAPILVLDEPTSNLDAETEQAIQAAIQRLMRRSTTLVIAHRLSTVMSADKILVLDKGRIVESGSHANLIARQGTYARLFAYQQAGFVN
jgi:thiol reductant ABC exporter CydC subunit